MSQATRPNDRHIIWSNQNLDVDDWREDYKEFLEANELDDDPNDEQALYEWMEETNYDYLSDERVNLNVQLSQPICALPGFVDSKNEEKTERNAGYLVVSHSGGGMLRQGTRKGIRRTPANRGMRAHRIVKSLDISEDVCHGLCP